MLTTRREEQHTAFPEVWSRLDEHVVRGLSLVETSQTDRALRPRSVAGDFRLERTERSHREHRHRVYHDMIEGMPTR